MPAASKPAKKSGGTTAASANEFQPPRTGVIARCEDTSEAMPLCPRLRLCLKPSACLGVAVDLPPLTDKCRSISNWEVMEQLRSMARPEQLGQLRVQSSSLEAIRFECHLATRRSLAGAIKQLDGGRIKLAGFADFLRVRALELKPPCPVKYDWEAFFRDAEGLDVMQPGERPDTVRIGQLPCAWFSEPDVASAAADATEPDDAAAAAAAADLLPPSESAVRAAFESFGAVRRVEIPMLLAGQGQGQGQGGLLGRCFEAFVQFADCASFERCVAGLRGARLLLLTRPTVLSVLPTLDFDRTGRLSERSLRRREAARQRAEAAAALAQRLQERERRRLERAEARRRAAESAALRLRIAAEERQIVAAQRKLQSVRLLGELFRRLREAGRREEMQRREMRLRRKLLNRRRAVAATAAEDEDDED